MGLFRGHRLDAIHCTYFFVRSSLLAPRLNMEVLVPVAGFHLLVDCIDDFKAQCGSVSCRVVDAFNYALFLGRNPAVGLLVPRRGDEYSPLRADPD